jgi:hypothetical protein
LIFFFNQCRLFRMLSLQGLPRDMRRILAEDCQLYPAGVGSNQQPSTVAAVEEEELSPKAAVKDALKGGGKTGEGRQEGSWQWPL